MVVRFKGKYRVESVRLRGWDYGAGGWYFVTVCTRGRRCWFGDVVDERMRLSGAGEIVAEEWRNTEEVRPSVFLDAWVGMPNHPHAILAITQGDASSPTIPVDATRRVIPPQRTVSSPGQDPSPQGLRPNSLGSIVGQFKAVCTKRIRGEGATNFAWQPSFHDHIIRSHRALNNIRKYIAANPSRWKTDKENPSNHPQPL